MEQATKPRSTPRYLGVVIAVMLIVAALDQLLKIIMVAWLEPGVPHPVIGDWFRFYLLFNPGAAFSMGQNSTWLFTTLQLVFVIGALWFGPRMSTRWEAFGLALVAGGALGNLCDRLFREPGFWFGHVVDYISVGSFAVFNLADAAITVGVVVFVVATFVAERKGDNDG
ncbi:signal peptidase II Aspartic peptidase. MEROPS family A08 [Corynebacterium coyleae]|uniref:Lipoprotein signal peptidase n=1 Tax=Corynebacterium coyleae TaxID=53374 RepID=A0ABX8KXQ1_9CORY|nr:signal peptidase II [Corynebacterium coyleae]QXB18690.1 signal peptidase II [Corynebacterium coyleae]UBI09953.1 signal peptidase II [Corynebacterium coyleae]WJY80218.1 Lipoprotein signal peptidase [Corynebacterium coyleae]SEB39491.1 signal peptidase II Aspartic peptidase. MEROPS family A08 [Corynebacterium coyleae]